MNEVELICGCCSLRSRIADPRYAREWPECCGQRMDRYDPRIGPPDDWDPFIGLAVDDDPLDWSYSNAMRKRTSEVT